MHDKTRDIINRSFKTFLQKRQFESISSSDNAAAGTIANVPQDSREEISDVLTHLSESNSLSDTQSSNRPKGGHPKHITDRKR